MIYSPGTVDQWPKNVSSHLMYGGMWTIPVPDVQRTDLFVVMGANPQASQGSLLACPDLMGEIDAIQRARRRGGRRRPASHRHRGQADRVGADHPRHRRRVPAGGRPGPVRRRAGRPRPRRARRSTVSTSCAARSWPTGRRSASQRPRASRPSASGRLAHELAERRTAVLYGRIGLCNQEFGTLASWLVDVVNILTGHFDVPGGLMFPRPPPGRSATLPMPGPGAAARPTSVAGAAGCAVRPRCSATCRSRASPRRSRRPARARSARCSRSPATRSCRPPRATVSTRRCAGLDA